MALKIKDNAGVVVKVPSMKEVNDRISARITATGTFKTINGTAITGSGNLTLEPAFTAGTASQYFNGLKTFVTPDATPTSSSTTLITSGAVYTAIESIINGTTPVSYDASIVNNASNTKAPLTQAVYTDVLAPFTTHKNNGDIHVTAAQKTAWTGKQDAITINGMLKGDGTGVVLASAGTDYQAPLNTYTANGLGFYKIQTNTYGQVIDATAVVASDLSGIGVAITDTTYNPVVAGSITPGLMTGADKTKLDNVEAGAQVNIIESISVNGTDVAPVSGNVALTIPTVLNSTITINSSNTSALPVSPTDTFTLNGAASTINFHQIAKTGTYSDLLSKPDLTVYLEKVSPATAGNFPVLAAGGVLVNSTFNSSSFATPASVATVASDLSDHETDTTNPHSVTLSQAATAQGTALTVVPAAGIYEGSDTSGSNKTTKYQTKTEVDNAISIAIQGGSKYLGQLKFGATAKTDMAALTTTNAPTLAVNDLCYNEETQKIYKYVSGTATADDVASVTPGYIWQLQPVTGTEAVGEYYDIVFWYGNWDNVLYVGEVPGTVTISDLTDPLNPDWDLIVYSSAVPDGVVTDSKIGNRGPLTNTNRAPLDADNVAQNLTGWLQLFYSNIRYLNANKANMVTGATAGNFPVLSSTGDLVNSAFNSNSFMAAGALNTGTLSTTSTTTVPSEKTVADAIGTVSSSVGNGQLSIILAPSDGSTGQTSNFTANQATASPVSVTINIPAAYTIGGDTGGDIEQDWTT
jgi:hypothetical protein